MIVEDMFLSVDEFELRTGWELKPEGFCKGDICVPAPSQLTRDAKLDVTKVASLLQMPMVSDADSGLSAVGPEAMGHSLTTAVAPELELDDVDGNPFSLSSLHGRKVLLMAWASW